MRRCGTYQLLEKVGTGSSGQVYRGQPEDKGQPPVAIKILEGNPPAALAGLTARLQKLEHPHLCRVVELGQDPEAGAYLVYQFVSGQDLETARQGFDGGKVPLRKALRWLRDALKGLVVLHDAGLLHGDLKPSNLMLDDQDRVVICDLTAVIPLEGKLDSDLKSGTPAYLPEDEALLRKPQRDLYALGLTLTGLLVGRLPKPGEAVVPSKMDPLLSPAVDGLVERSLGGFTTAVEMLDALETLLGGPRSEPTTSASLSPPTRRVELKQADLKLALWPWLVAILMLPLGVAARTHFSEPQAKVEATVLWTGISLKPAVFKRTRIWQTTILGRPVVPFAGPDELNGEDSAASRAAWCAAVLEEAHFKKRALVFDYRKELPDSCEVWLTGKEQTPQFLFRVTARESDLFDRPAPLLARYWCALVQDSAELARPGARGTEKTATALLLKPWTRRFETLTANHPELSQQEHVKLRVEALYSLEQELRQDILEGTLNPPEEEKKAEK